MVSSTSEESSFTSAASCTAAMLAHQHTDRPAGALEDITNVLVDESKFQPEKKRARGLVDVPAPPAPQKNVKKEHGQAVDSDTERRRQDGDEVVAAYVSRHCVVCRMSKFSSPWTKQSPRWSPASDEDKDENIQASSNESFFSSKSSIPSGGLPGRAIHNAIGSTSWCSNPSTILKWLRPGDSIGQLYTLDDPLYVADYVQEMHHHFRIEEVRTSVRSRYMEKQHEITPRMRSILVDWLVDVHRIFRLTPETLYLTVNVLDRYLERREVSKLRLQLVGITSLFIACKYEETILPRVDSLVRMCDEAYTHAEILAMEESILQALSFRCTVPNAYTFLKLYLPCAHADERLAHLSFYILDSTLHSYDLLFCPPSKLAAAVIWIARSAVGRTPWSPTLYKHVLYSEKKLLPVAQAILDEKTSIPDELDAVQRKFSCQTCGGVSSMDLAFKP